MCHAGPQMAAQQDTTVGTDEAFSTHDIAEGVAHDLVLQAEEFVQAARGLPVMDPVRISLTSAAAAALAAATPFVAPPPRIRARRAPPTQLADAILPA